ncbi:MAG: PilX N-terminal domain-containing pilus assembly protein [Vicinamibacteria bacterium]
MSPRKTSHESGFALILALLALVLLTTMGLALSNSTSVELQISSNQRWSEAARYNAEAGIEYGKSILMAAPSWDAILPSARAVAVVPDWTTTAWTGAAASATNPATYANGQPILTRATRSWESWKCDQRGFGMGYGVVYDDGLANGPEEYRSQIGGATLNGAFTLWVRRPVRWDQVDPQGFATGTKLQDYAGNDVLVLVAEGVAPFTGSSNTNAFAASNRAVYTIETLLVRTGTTILDQSACSSRQGQAGGSSSGGNSSGCVVLTAGRQITEALAGTPGVGSGDILK